MTIKAGDLVIVVRWPCCGANVGKVAVVEGIDYFQDTYCAYCGAEPLGKPNADFVATEIMDLSCAPLAWLKKIDPLSEPEHIERSEETTA